MDSNSLILAGIARQLASSRFLIFRSGRQGGQPAQARLLSERDTRRGRVDLRRRLAQLSCRASLLAKR